MKYPVYRRRRRIINELPNDPISIDSAVMLDNNKNVVTRDRFPTLSNEMYKKQESENQLKLIKISLPSSLLTIKKSTSFNRKCWKGFSPGIRSYPSKTICNSR